MITRNFQLFSGVSIPHDWKEGMCSSFANSAFRGGNWSGLLLQTDCTGRQIILKPRTEVINHSKSTIEGGSALGGQIRATRCG